MEQSHLQRVNQELQEIITEVKHTFLDLDYKQFNWKPHPKKWSIAEYMQHLLIVNSKYRPQMLKKITNTSPKANLDKPYQSTFMGRLFMGFVNPDKFRKTPAPGFLKPEKGSEYPLYLRKKYLDYLEETCGFIQKSDQLNLNRIMINSSIGPIIRFNLGDLFEIESMHNRRHVAQMKGMIKMEKFPQN